MEHATERGSIRDCTVFFDASIKISGFFMPCSTLIQRRIGREMRTVTV